MVFAGAKQRNQIILLGSGTSFNIGAPCTHIAMHASDACFERHFPCNTTVYFPDWVVLRGLLAQALAITTNKPHYPGAKSDPDMYFGFDLKVMASALGEDYEELLWGFASAGNYIATLTDAENTVHVGPVRLWWRADVCSRSNNSCGRWDPYDVTARRWLPGDTMQLYKILPNSRFINDGCVHMAVGVGQAPQWVCENKDVFLKLPVKQCHSVLRFEMKHRDNQLATASSFGFEEPSGAISWLLTDAHRPN